MELLKLESPRWSSLRHAFGSAEDIPSLIRALNADPKTDASTCAWEQLWTRVHHQGSVYDASYATVPHLVQIVLGQEAQ